MKPLFFLFSLISSAFLPDLNIGKQVWPSENGYIYEKRGAVHQHTDDVQEGKEY